MTVKQTVATRYIKSEKVQPHTFYSSQVESCAEAARRNCALTQHLSEINQVVIHSIPIYHYAFAAGIVLQLVRLIPEVYKKDDLGAIKSISNYLVTAGEKGNESARDCARMVLELGSVVSRLSAVSEPQTLSAISTGP